MVSNCQNTAPEQSTVTEIDNHPRKLVCLGGDWTIGAGLESSEAYPALLSNFVEEGVSMKIVNAGIKGESVQGAAARVDWILQQRLNTLLLAYGLTDAKKNVPLSDQIEAWDTLLGKIRRANPALTIVVLDTGVVYRKGTSPELVEIMKKHDARIIDLGLLGPEKAPGLWQSDGTLLSAKGQCVVAEKLSKLIL